MNYDNPAFILAALLTLGVLLSIRISRDSERIALNTPNHFVKLIGPGLFLQLPWPISPYKYTRIRIGDVGRYIGHGWAQIHGENMPVHAVEPLETDQAFEIKSFVNREIFVVATGERH